MNATPSLAQLKQAVQLCEQIEKLQLELEALLTSTRSALATRPTAALLKKPRSLMGPGAARDSRVSAQGSQRIAAAQRRRWARFRRARQEATAQSGLVNGNGSSTVKAAEDSAAEN